MVPLILAVNVNHVDSDQYIYLFEYRDVQVYNIYHVYVTLFMHTANVYLVIHTYILFFGSS